MDWKSRPMPDQRSRTDRAAVAVTIERPEAAELNSLYVALGWGEHSLEKLRSSIAAYTATICARTVAGLLVGYASLFSDRCLTTMFGEFVVHPEFQWRGVGSAMMQAVEGAFPAAPIYVHALDASREFFSAHGFRSPTRPVTGMSRRPAGAPEPAHGFATHRDGTQVRSAGASAPESCASGGSAATCEGARTPPTAASDP